MITIDLFNNEDGAAAFAAGQKIFNEGEKGEVMFVVVSGEVDLLVRGKLVESLGHGGVLGEMALIDSAPRSASAIAKTDCRLAPIDQRRFTFLVQQTPHFALQIMRVMANRLRRMDDRL